MKKVENPNRKLKQALSESGPVDALTGREDHRISLQEASELTRAYRQHHPDKHIAEFFGKETLLAILAQENCAGIRIYYGMDPKTNRQHLVLVGAEPNKNDIDQGIIAERGILCPSCCGKPSILNT